jgi:uncharacterized protein (DUF58 family)
MPNILPPDVLSRAQALGLKARTIVEGLRVGDHKSPFRGFSVEFVQHREYVPGDDIRHIDWKSYGRSERYTIKQYEQETNFIAHLVLDASKSMVYGEGESNKFQYARTLTAVLTYLIIHQRDSCGLDLFDENWRDQIAPSSQTGHVQTILYALESAAPRKHTTIGPLLQQLAEKARRRGLVFLISDCLDDVESILAGLRYLRFQGHEVTVFHLLHNDELELPFNGMTRFDGLEMPRQLLTRPHLIRPAYIRALKEYLTKLRSGCEAQHCDYVLMDTTKPLGAALQKYLAARLLVRRI